MKRPFSFFFHFFNLFFPSTQQQRINKQQTKLNAGRRHRRCILLLWCNHIISGIIKYTNLIKFYKFTNYTNYQLPNKNNKITKTIHVTINNKIIFEK